MKNIRVSDLQKLLGNRADAKGGPNKRITMLIEGVEFIVLRVEVLSSGMRSYKWKISGREEWSGQVEMGPTPPELLGGVPPPFVRNETAKKLLKIGVPPEPIKINIHFPTFLWTAFYGAISKSDIPTIENILAGKIISGFLVLQDDLNIPGKIVELSNMQKVVPAANLDKNGQESSIPPLTDEMSEKLHKILAAQDAQGRQLSSMDRKLDGVPPLVESAKENVRDAMGEFYRVVYDGFTPKQKAVCDAMLRARSCVREASRILTADKWVGVSPASVSRILKNTIDPAFKRTGKPNPFESRKNNRFRPIVTTTYRKHRVDPDNDQSDEVVPIRREGYGQDETIPETP